MTPLEYYREQIEKGFITADPEQFSVVQTLTNLQTALIQENSKREGFLKFLHSPRIVKGMYLWGGVGIGKTFLMDCFYHTLPFENKVRMHFHQFMRLVHEKLTQHQGEPDPLKNIAKEFSRAAIVLCFDEFFVSDITDAMLLGRLIKALFANGLCLVATSNVAPDDLYKNGLQRSQFIPAIKLLNTQTTVVHMPTVIDYRLRHLKEAGVFYTPLDAAAVQNMEKTFDILTAGKKIDYAPIAICGREIKIQGGTDDIVWVEFHDICHVPRSQKDYLAIAERFKTIFVSNIPIIQPNEKDTISLFINLIDVLYDARVRIVFSAAEPVEQIYNRGYMIMEYARTNSRLLEMQSADYFALDEFRIENK
jgi:cell division protein ZapE